MSIVAVGCLLEGPSCSAGGRVGLHHRRRPFFELAQSQGLWKPRCSTHFRLGNEQVLMRGIADQCATRLARHGASDFTVTGLSMLCWAYSKLRVRRCLKVCPPLSWLLSSGMGMLP